MVISQPEILDLLNRIYAYSPLAIANNRHIGITGPSGSGKSTIIRSDEKSIISSMPDVYGFSISGASRLPRKNEKHGKDYFFFDSVEFFQKERFIEDNAYAGNGKLYGTLVSEIERIAIKERKRICFDVDLNGGVALKQIFKKDFLFGFLDVPIETLYSRLIKRIDETGETEKQVDMRILAATKEKYRVKSGEVVPDFILPYDDNVTPGAAATQFLFKASFPFAVEQKMIK